jgi:hypothetical protein
VRCLSALAVKDRHLSAEFNPAQPVKKPRRGQPRMAIDPHHLEQLFEFVDNSGNDPELDRIPAQTPIIAGARRDGLVNLTLGGAREAPDTPQEVTTDLIVPSPSEPPHRRTRRRTPPIRT